MTEHISAEDVIARIDDWNGKNVRFEVLGGGITNRNYLVTVDGDPRAPGVGRFVLRIPGEGTETFIDRTRELNNHAAAAAAGVTPPLLHVIQPGDCTVVPFIQGETMHPESLAAHPDRLQFRARGAEYGLRRPETVQQFPRRSGAQTVNQFQRQPVKFLFAADNR